VARSKLRTRKFDIAHYLKTERDVVGYLEAAFEDGHPLVIAAALGDVARARGMSTIARKAGLSRESLYKALAPDGNPRLSTILSVLSALGLTLRVESESSPHHAEPMAVRERRAPHSKSVTQSRSKKEKNV
jgi:probable addiction module antidote protein